MVGERSEGESTGRMAPEKPRYLRSNLLGTLSHDPASFAQFSIFSRKWGKRHNPGGRVPERTEELHADRPEWLGIPAGGLDARQRCQVRPPSAVLKSRPSAAVTVAARASTA